MKYYIMSKFIILDKKDALEFRIQMSKYYLKWLGLPFLSFLATNAFLTKVIKIQSKTVQIALLGVMTVVPVVVN